MQELDTVVGPEGIERKLIFWTKIKFSCGFSYLQYFLCLLFLSRGSKHNEQEHQPDEL